jgi:hypothetical protein
MRARTAFALATVPYASFGLLGLGLLALSECQQGMPSTPSCELAKGREIASFFFILAGAWVSAGWLAYRRHTWQMLLCLLGGAVAATIVDFLIASFKNG